MCGKDTQLPQIIENILVDRGLRDWQSQKEFLYPSLKDLPDPEQMLQLQTGARLIREYVERRSPIIIWGDYDVDGTTGTALLLLFLRWIGIEADWHIPNRLEEGYGLNSDWFIARREQLVRGFLLITVDCGISDAHVIEHIQSLGGEVIVTDHHQVPEDGMPQCIVINPSQAACGFNTYKLAGVGVAFYLAAALRKELSARDRFQKIYQQINLKDLLPLVALGTISDIVELTKINRILVRAGLEHMQKCKITGLQALLKFAGVEDEMVTSEDIGYLIGPKINAAGRLGKSRAVVELLVEPNWQKACALARKLISLNEQRKVISADSLDLALTNISKTELSEKRCLVLRGAFHKGVAGIVASSLVEQYQVPVILVCENDNQANGVLTGSARSVDSINILSLIQGCKKYLEKFGGHFSAAGLTIKPENFSMFKHCIEQKVKNQRSDSHRIIVESPYDLNQPIDTLLQQDILKYYNLLEPFGPENPQPVFKVSKTVVLDAKSVGKNRSHLNVILRGKFSKVRGIGFSLGEKLNELQREPERDIVFTITRNRVRGTTSYQLRIVDI